MPNNGATMLGGLQLMSASHSAFLVIIPLLLLIVGLILHTRHTLAVFELRRSLANAIFRWTAVLESVQDTHVLKQPDVIEHRPDEYDGLSRVKYEEAREIWAKWQSQRQKLEERVSLAKDLLEKIQNNTWWKFSLRRPKQSAEMLTQGPVQLTVTPISTEAAHNGDTSASEMSAEEFLQDLISSADTARTSADYFAHAFNASSETVRKLRAVADTRISEDGGLIGQKHRLLSLDLPLDPYQDRFNAVLKFRDDLTIKVMRQPLSDYAEAVSNLQAQVINLEKDLAFACAMHATKLSTAELLLQLTSRVAELRSSPVPSPLPGVDIQACWTLNEDGYELDADIAEAARCSAEFSLALEHGNLKVLEKLDRFIRDTISKANRTIEKTMAEKLCFEQKFAEITASSTEADLAADNETRQSCLSSYASQKWGQARTSCETFYALHSKRLAAREDGQKLQDRMAVVASLRRFNIDVTSIECDEAFARLVKSVDDLIVETAYGEADWDSLRNRIISVRESKTAGSIESFLDQLKSEINARSNAMAAVAKLTSELRYTDEKTSDKWGGAEARSILETVTTVVEEAIASAEAKKQDWVELSQRVQKASELLSPALQMVSKEVARDKQEYERLCTLSGDIEACKNIPYTRAICGRVYGQGIYCPTTEPAQKLVLARELHAKRRYEETSLIVSDARKLLIEAHLDAWWLCLQVLACSPDPCARQFALAEGYESSSYDQWMETRTKLALQGSLFNISEIRCEKHQASSFVEEATGDAPSISDYASGALVSR